MCRLKSGIILKDRVYVPEHDHHTQMLEELNIADTKANAERLFVRAEIYPSDGDIFSDPDTWWYQVDQDILPDWYVAKVDESRMREAVKEWYKQHVHIDEDGLVLEDGTHWIKGGKGIQIKGSANVKCICDSATVENICDSATVKNIYGSATVKNIYDSATVEYIFDSATVKYIYGSATVNNIYDSATVKYIFGSATVNNIYDSATVITSPCCEWRNIDKANLQDNATIKDSYNKRIIQAGDWSLQKSKT